MFVVNERAMDVYRGCYNGVCLSMFVVNERVRELLTFTVGVTMGCVCLCVTVVAGTGSSHGPP